MELNFAYNACILLSDSSDKTNEVFYDVGPLAMSDELKSLETYAHEQLTGRRPIWLINAREP